MKQLNNKTVIDIFKDLALSIAKAWCAWADEEDQKIIKIIIKNNEIKYFFPHPINFPEFNSDDLNKIQKTLLQDEEDGVGEKYYMWGAMYGYIFFKIKPEFHLHDEVIEA